MVTDEHRRPDSNEELSQRDVGLVVPALIADVSGMFLLGAAFQSTATLATISLAVCGIVAFAISFALHCLASSAPVASK